MNCPICNDEKLNELDSQCQACGSELSAFKLINRVSNQRSNLKKAVTLVSVAAFVALSGWAFTYMKKSEAPAKNEKEAALNNTGTTAETDALREEMIKKDQEIAALKLKIGELSAVPSEGTNGTEANATEGGSIRHVVKRGESLWTLSEFVHGTGYRNLEIAANNGIKNPDVILPGDVIVINLDK